LGHALHEGFEQAHYREFGFIGKGTVVLVNLRLRALAVADTVRFADLSAGRMKQTAVPSHPRDVYFGPEHGLRATTIVGRDAIAGRYLGPIIVEDPDTTVVVPPGWSVSRHENGSLVLARDS
jgi:N-methylhydantoinase A